MRAWVIIKGGGQIEHNNAVFGTRREADADRRRSDTKERTVRCEIHYDDGKPRKRARRK